MTTPNRSETLVLVLDDDLLIQAMLGDILRGAGLTPLVARSAEQAESLLAQRPFMAFVDVHLPGKQGDAFCRQLRMSEQWWDLPVVMITGLEDSSIVHRSFAAGADDFALKPLNAGHLLAKTEAVRAGIGAQRTRPARGRTVLLGTPKAYFGRVLGLLLENGGYTVERAQTAGQALRLVSEKASLHLAVLDLELGDKVDAVAQALDARSPAIPVVAVTSGPALPPPPYWTGKTLFDVDTELERIVRQVNGSLLGAGVARERRGNARVPFNTVVQFRPYGHGREAWHPGYGYDLSETGIFVRSLNAIEAGKPLELSFRLSPDDRPLTAKGLVVWKNSAAPRTVSSYPGGMGAAFSDFDLGEWVHLRDWIQAKLKGPSR